MELREEDKKALFDCDIPGYMHGAIVNWIEDGLKPGDFLTAVIDNNLKEAALRADDTNINYLKDYIMWFYNHAPSDIWGFAGATEKWCERVKAEQEALA